MNTHAAVRRAIMSAAGVLILSTSLVACSAEEPASSAATPAATVTVTETVTTIPDAPEETEETVADTSFVPKPSDFKIGIRIRSKECFGSAGCNVIFQIDPQYVGSQSLGDGAYDVTYEVRGGSDTIINTFQIDGGSASFDEEEMADLRSAGVRLTAKVTDVYEQ